MKTFYITFLFIFSSLHVLGGNTNDETIRAAKAINEMLVKNYDDDFYKYHGIRASVADNNLFVMFFTSVTSFEKYPDVGTETWNELGWQVYQVLIEQEVRCEDIGHIIVYLGNTGFHIKCIECPFHLTGKDWASLVEANYQKEEFLKRTLNMHGTKEIVKLRKQQRALRMFHLNYGGTDASSRNSIE